MILIYIMAFRNICSLTFGKTITLGVAYYCKAVLYHFSLVLMILGIVVFNKNSNMDMPTKFDLLF